MRWNHLADYERHNLPCKRVDRAKKSTDQIKSFNHDLDGYMKKVASRWSNNGFVYGFNGG